MNNYAPPLQGTANNLAKYGRYGDSMLVHMNPIEVQGIAALSPTGRLTTNPVTGQQEAFLPFLAPLLGSIFGLGSLGTAALSGALTWARTGDFKKGLLSGITGFGIGKIFGGGLGEAATEATKGVTAGTGDLTTNLAGDLATNLAGDLTGDLATNLAGDLTGDLTTNLAGDLTGGLTDVAGTSVGPFSGTDFSNVLDTSGLTADFSDIAGTSVGPYSGMDFSNVLDTSTSPSANEAPWWGRTGPKLGDKDFFSKENLSAMGKSAISPEAIVPITFGSSELANLEAQEALQAQIEGEDGDEDKRKSEEEIARAYAQIAQDYGTPYSRPGAASVTTYANSGGLVSLNPMDYQNKRRGLAQLTGEPVRMSEGGPAYQSLNLFDPFLDDMGEEFGSINSISSNRGGNYTPADASRAQSNLRGSQLISAPQMQALSAAGYRPGFSPELQYFRSPDKVYANDPFGGFIDPMNPNAPVLPTEEQLAQTAENERQAQLEEALALAENKVSAADEQRNNYYLNNLDNLMDNEYGDTNRRTGYVDLSEDGRVLYDYDSDPVISSPVVSSPVVSAPIETLPPESIVASMSNMNDFIGDEPTDFDLPAYRRRIIDLERGKTPVPPRVIAPAPVMPLPIVPPVIQPPSPAPVIRPPVLPTSSKPNRSNYGRGGNAKYKADLKEWNEQQMAMEEFGFNSGGITNLAEGGLVKMQDMGQVPEMESGIASVVADSMEGIDPAVLQLAQQTAMAILGQVSPEQADAIIQAFIQQFGVEQFQALRQEVLNSIEPGAQNEGMIQGQGDGMSDEIMGSIGDQQRVAVSPGEFIVPADVVSGIGNGSSDAGAGELDRMMADIRQARTGMTNQPPAIDPRGAMPA